MYIQRLVGGDRRRVCVIKSLIANNCAADPIVFNGASFWFRSIRHTRGHERLRQISWKPKVVVRLGGLSELRRTRRFNALVDGAIRSRRDLDYAGGARLRLTSFQERVDRSLADLPSLLIWTRLPTRCPDPRRLYVTSALPVIPSIPSIAAR